MKGFLTNLEQYRRLTRSKNKALSQLRIKSEMHHSLAMDAHFDIVIPIWERYGYGVGRPPDRRSSNGKACDDECYAEDVCYWAKMDELRLGYTANRKRIIDEYNKAVNDIQV